eukprot:746812-Hanusia_phi.AAC.2
MLDRICLVVAVLRWANRKPGRRRPAAGAAMRLATKLALGSIRPFLDTHFISAHDRVLRSVCCILRFYRFCSSKTLFLGLTSDGADCGGAAGMADADSRRRRRVGANAIMGGGGCKGDGEGSEGEGAEDGCQTRSPDFSCRWRRGRATGGRYC